MPKATERRNYPFELVGLAGTFDHLHVGHRKLLTMAFKQGQKVAIGLTTDELLINKQYKDKIQSYDIREKCLRDFIEKELNVSWKYYNIIPLNDPFGPAITEPNLEAHISSEETYQGAMKINEMRIKNKLKPLVLIIIPLETDTNGIKISSTEIRKNI
jgi:cytidyltransferase-like protein